MQTADIRRLGRGRLFCLRLRCCNFKGQRDGENRAYALLAFNRNRSLHFINQAFHNRHAKPRSLTGAVAALLREGREDMLQKFLAHADTRITDDPTIGNPSVRNAKTADSRFHPAAAFIIFDTVAINIQENLPQMEGTAINSADFHAREASFISQRDACFRGTLFHNGQNIPRQLI